MRIGYGYWSPKQIHRRIIVLQMEMRALEGLLDGACLVRNGGRKTRPGVFERRQKVQEMHASGMSFCKIGVALSVSRVRAFQIFKAGKADANHS